MNDAKASRRTGKMSRRFNSGSFWLAISDDFSCRKSCLTAHGPGLSVPLESAGCLVALTVFKTAVDSLCEPRWVQFPPSPFDAAGVPASLTAGRSSAESNVLSKRSASKGITMTASASADSFFVYILRCSDGSLYVGYTSDVQNRVKLHNEGSGARWTASGRPVHLVYQPQHHSKTRASARERQLKRWSQGGINLGTNGVSSLCYGDEGGVIILRFSTQ
jgi:putative endonuclease